MENSKYVVEMDPYDKEMPTPKSKDGQDDDSWSEQVGSVRRTYCLEAHRYQDTRPKMIWIDASKMKIRMSCLVLQHFSRKLLYRHHLHFWARCAGLGLYPFARLTV